MTPTADSSPAPVDATPDLATLSPADLASWRATGEIPSPPPADSASAAPDAPASSTEESSAAVSETAPTSPAPKRGNADTRVQELLAERHELRERLAALERRQAEIAPSPAPATPTTDDPPSLEAVIAQPNIAAPRLSESQFFASFPDASYGEYARYIARYELAADREQDRQQRVQAATHQAVETRVTTFLERRQAAIAADPSFAERISEAVATAVPLDLLAPHVPPGPHNLAAQEIVESPVAPQLMLHYSQHPDEWQALTHLSPPGVVRAVAKVAARFETPSLTPKTVSDAPAPPRTLGTRAAQPADEVEGAVVRGDFLTYRSAMNRREAGR